MSKSHRDFDSFLQLAIRKNGEEFTHTRIPSKKLNIYGGSYTIKDIETFYKTYYNKVFVNGKCECLTEKQIENGQILVDLDFRYDTDIEGRLHGEEHIDDLIELYLEEIKNICIIKENEKFPIFVFEKKNVNRQHDVTKDGIHLIIGISMPHSIQMILRDNILKKIGDIIEDLPLVNNYESVLDIGISKGTTNWQLYGSKKPGNEPYHLIKHYDVYYDEDKETVLEEYDLDKPKKNYILELLPTMSARNTDCIKFDFIDSVKKRANEQSIKKKKISKTNKIKIVQKTTIHSFENIENQEELNNVIEEMLNNAFENNEYHIKEAHDYAMCLSEKFYEPQLKWMDIGWTLFGIDYCLFPTWIAFSAKSDKFTFDSVPEYFEIWNKMEKKGKTLGSLIYWAREDNPSKFKEIKENSISHYINKTLEGETEYDIAKVLYKMWGDNYKCVSISKKIWYEYKKGRWNRIEVGCELRKKLSTSLHQEYIKREKEMTNRICSTTDEDERAKLQQTVQKLATIAMKLKKTKWKNDIMREAAEQFYDNKFNNKLDSNPYLICFKNGIIDLENDGIFRKGRPSDYVSLCTNINYVKYDELHEEHVQIKNEIELFFSQLFPNPELNKYMWEHLASILLGKNLNQTFNIYTGCGRNGKSKLVEFMSHMLGDYKGTVPISLVTQRRGSIGGVSPEIAQLKGLRYAVMQEPSKGMILNEGMMKELTGGDPIQGRALYLDTVTYIPQFTLAVCTNHLFDINTTDEGTWRRIRVCDYVSRFVTDPSKDVRDHEFLVDPNIDKNFDRWREIAMSLLVKLLIKTQGDVQDCDIVMASSQKYKAQQDYFTAFFNERIIPAKERKIKRRDVLEVFKEWYIELYGGKIPNGKDLYEFLEKKMGKPKKGNGWVGWKLIQNYEDDDEFESENIL